MEQESDRLSKASEQDEDASAVTWGPKLFIGAVVALLVFFWWLLIYSGGVSGHH